MPNVYCAICGVILLPDPQQEDEPGSAPFRRRPWYAEVRGLVPTNTHDQAFLTGIGLICGRYRLHAPVEASQSYVDCDEFGDWGVGTPIRGAWAFGVHNSCWQLLLLRLHAFQQCQIVTSVFRFLYCIPLVGASRFDFGHDYDGASRTHKISGRPLPIDPDSHLYADPYEGVSIDRLSLPLVGRPEPCTRYSKNSRFAAFGFMSPELFYEILSYLPARTVARLRLQCRDLADLAAIDNLPLFYWRSRFLIGEEADFVFPNHAERRDWFRLFFAVKTSLNNEDNNHLINRRRVRNLLEHIARVAEEDSSSVYSLCGNISNPVQASNGRALVHVNDAIQITIHKLEERKSFRGYTNDHSNQPLYEGCRAVKSISAPLLCPAGQASRGIMVSTRRIGGKFFISSIGVASSKHSTENGSIVGYHNQSTADFLDIPAIPNIESIHVAICSEGVTGIKFTFRDRTASGWIGVSEGPGVAQGILTLGDNPRTPYLRVEVDFYKIVSIGTCYPVDGQKPASLHLPSPSTSLSRYTDLWNPCPPTYNQVYTTPLQPSPPRLQFEYLLNMDFGGPGGHHLSDLTGLVCFMGNDPHAVHGLMAFYTDGRSVLFGSKRGCGLSFAISGPMGERIVEIRIMRFVEDNVWDGTDTRIAPGLAGLQVITNLGRRADFATIRTRLQDYTEPLPTPEPNNVITGFAVRPIVSLDTFGQIALQVQPSIDAHLDICKPTDTLPTGVSRECLEYDKEFSSYVRTRGTGNYQTYATLDGLISIQASVGAHGQSRAQPRISGVRLRFDNRPPIILGQWIDEQDVFELSSKETIARLTIWIVVMAYSSEYRTQMGQVVCISIGTSLGRVKTFIPSGVDLDEIETIRQQYGGGAEKKLGAISWVLNAYCDRIRAGVSDMVRRPSMMLPERYPPVDQVQMLYFDNVQGAGNGDPLAIARAHFRNTALLGLTFSYESGEVSHVGDVDITPNRTDAIEFPHKGHYRVIGMSVRSQDHSVRSLQV
ncbi:F-box protein [Aspergillus stella-maris]|uniref:F-box protein n=1 Tax=Aspergillus stella-maris TaxID=1810926 RepID=UPI003CCD8C81